MASQSVMDSGNPIFRLVEPFKGEFLSWFWQSLKSVEPATRIERVTYGLRNHCSTTELRRLEFNLIQRR